MYNICIYTSYVHNRDVYNKISHEFREGQDTPCGQILCIFSAKPVGSETYFFFK